MNWIEISIQTSHEATEAVANTFHDLGAGGVVIEDAELINRYRNSGEWDYCDIPEAVDTDVVIVKAYLPADDFIYEKLQDFEEFIEELATRDIDKGRGVIDCRTVREDEWASAWKEHFHAFRVGHKIVVRPPWEEYEPEANDIVVTIDPGAAFGTGNHASTAMCICFLEDIIKEGDVVFDIGTGSGILSLVAAKLGASKVDAVDNDLVAVKVSCENAVLNQLNEKIAIRHGDLLKGISGQADVIVANIVADVIIKMLPSVKEKLSPNGYFISGGIISERLDDVVTAMKEAGLVLDKVSEESVWRAILARCAP